jgi:rhodanese-related sulfurtransferase
MLMNTSIAKPFSTVFLLAACLAGPDIACSDDEPVNITPDLPYVDVMNKDKSIRIKRNPDPLNTIASDYALTSRPCPPFCVQPMVLAPGVETIGELEMLDYLRIISQGNNKFLVIDSRTEDWTKRTGMIPGAISIPWDKMALAMNDLTKVADILEDRFGAHRNGPFWEFSQAKTLILYCNGPWCGQSPSNIKTLLSIGYPANKLKWYRGGMQNWQSLGLTTVKP